jgi:metal-dependent amidase/aminoacylase/carboxypeptidase family protein
MFAEDFSFYQQVVPGMFMMLGTKNEEKKYTHPLHSCYFNFDEKVFTKAISLYDAICKFYKVYQ